MSVDDNQLPCNTVRVACSNHLSVYTVSQFSVYYSFPQISSLCFHSCEVALQSIYHQGYQTDVISHIEQQQKQAKQTVQQKKTGTSKANRQTSTQPKSRQKRQDRRSSQHPPTPSQRELRSSHIDPTQPAQGVRSNQVKSENALSKKKGEKLEYSVTDFIRDIETIYYTPRQHKFWIYYQNVNSEPSFKDVMSISPGNFKASDYVVGKNVLWSYHRDEHSLPTVANYKLVK